MVAITYWSILPCITITQTLHDTVHNACAHHVRLQWNVCDIHDMLPCIHMCTHSSGFWRLMQAHIKVTGYSSHELLMSTLFALIKVPCVHLCWLKFNLQSHFY